MSELYRLIGPNIRKELEGLRPAQLEQLEQAFSELDGGNGGQPPVQNKKQKETIVTNIDPTGGKGGAKKGAKNMRQSDDEQEEMGDEVNDMLRKQGGRVQNSPLPGQRGKAPNT